VRLANLPLTGCGKTFVAREHFDGPRVWQNKRTFSQDAQKGDLLTRPTLARQDAPCPKQGRSSVLLAFKRVAWIGPKPRASREHILIVRTLRAKGTIQATVSILFQHPATEET
jgi:hypothetical protein